MQVPSALSRAVINRFLFMARMPHWRNEATEGTFRLKTFEAAMKVGVRWEPGRGGMVMEIGRDG